MLIAERPVSAARLRCVGGRVTMREGRSPLNRALCGHVRESCRFDSLGSGNGGSIRIIIRDAQTRPRVD